MSDSFQGVDKIVLQPGSATVPYTFTFAACSSATANDGSIPFGTTISTAVIKAFDEVGTDSTAALISAQSLVSPVVTVSLKWPTTAGRYSLEFVLTLSTSAVMEFDFTRVYAEDTSA